jgi:hypothetical protein
MEVYLEYGTCPKALRNAVFRNEKPLRCRLEALLEGRGHESFDLLLVLSLKHVGAQ